MHWDGVLSHLGVINLLCGERPGGECPCLSTSYARSSAQNNTWETTARVVLFIYIFIYLNYESQAGTLYVAKLQGNPPASAGIGYVSHYDWLLQHPFNRALSRSGNCQNKVQKWSHWGTLRARETTPRKQGKNLVTSVSPNMELFSECFCVPPGVADRSELTSDYLLRPALLLGLYG